MPAAVQALVCTCEPDCSFTTTDEIDKQNVAVRLRDPLSRRTTAKPDREPIARGASVTDRTYSTAFSWISFRVSPASVFHSTLPFALRPSRIDAAVDGELNL